MNVIMNTTSSTVNELGHPDSLLENAIQQLERIHQEAKSRLSDHQAAIASLNDRLDGHGLSTSVSRRSWGAAMVASSPYRRLAESKSSADLRGKVQLIVRAAPGETKDILGNTTTTGAPALADRQFADPTPLPRRPLRIRDLLAPGNTNSFVVEYIVQSARNNNAAPVQEGARMGQSNPQWSVLAAPVGFIGHYVKESRNLFDDSAAMQAAIDGELTYGLNYVEDRELLIGTGATGYLNGLLNQATAYVAPYSPVGETAIDRILVAKAQANIADVQSDGIVLNTTDYDKMCGLKDGQGRYVMGEPSRLGPPILWNLPVAASTAMPAGSFLVGAFQTAQLYDRSEVVIEIATENEDDFINNLITIKATRRAALAVKRPQSIILGTLP